MEFNIDALLNIAGWLFGGGAIGGFATWQFTRRKAKAEAVTAEAAATKEIQDVYQQLVSDVKADRDEQKAYIGELKDDRRLLRQERDELRDRIDRTEEMVRQLQLEVAKNGRKLECLRPFICGRRGCPERIAVDITEEGEVKKSKTKK